MRPFLLVVAFVLVSLAVIWLLPGDDRGIGELRSQVNAPWVVQPHEDGTSEVLGLHLGVDTLDDALSKFGPPDSIALFVNPEGDRSLEVYFGDAQSSPMKAKIVLILHADQPLLDEIAANAATRDRTAHGEVRLFPSERDKSRLGPLRLSGVTYIPGYRGLDADFFRERLGEPAGWRQEAEQAVSWFYPGIGLSLLIDAAGSEVFELVPPADFRMPEDAATSPQ